MSVHNGARSGAGVGKLLEAGFAFNYDDLALVPRVVSTLAHRADAQPATHFGPFRLALPLLGSPMPDVCGADMCRVLAREGAMGPLHRFQPIESQQREFEQASRQQETTATAVSAAIGITGDYRERFQALYAAGCRVFCLDTANGAHVQVEQALIWLRGRASDLFLVAGNVASAEAFRWLEERGADAIRVGIAGGSVCETRTETGVFVPTPYAVAEASAVRSFLATVEYALLRTSASCSR